MYIYPTRGKLLGRKFVCFSVAVLLGSVPFSLPDAEQPHKAATTQPPTGNPKTEHPANFEPAAADPLSGDWQGQGGYVAQVFPTSGGKYQANLLTAFDTENNVIAVLQGAPSGQGVIIFSGDDWHGVIQDGHFTARKGDKMLDVQRVSRPPPTLGARPPNGAVVLFAGRNLDHWAKKAGKNWLQEDGPARWKLVEGGAVEVVPGSDCIISHEKFGDCKLHLEFRTLGAPTNSGVYLQDRYEVNINETYGRIDLSPNAGFDNCSENAKPRIRPCRPLLEWQTFDIEFHAPRFDSRGNKIAKARDRAFQRRDNL
ncbi:MAG TPA: DUF1080 domain-containing protein [Gemmataceae bacterium]|nr:DUF1080 domain-containing protein [Gemmataceae bacterium]